MPREVKRSHSLSDTFQWISKENKILIPTPKQKNYQNITTRKLTVNRSSVNNQSCLDSKNTFIPSNVPVFIDKSHQKPRLRRSISEKILPLVELYEKVNVFELSSNKEALDFLPKRIRELRIADHFKNEIETPMGIFNKPIPYTPVKVKHRRSKLHKLKSAVNITAQLFQYSDDIILYYEQQEDRKKRIFPSYEARPVSLREWKHSVNSIIILAVKLHFPPALTYHAIKILDNIFYMGVLKKVPSQLLEITALWLIAKKDYVYSKLPTIDEVIKCSNYYFTLKKLIDCEWNILQKLNFDINYPDLISIVMYNVKTYYGCDYTHANFGSYYYIGAYMLDTLLFNRKIIQKSSLLIAGVISSLAKIWLTEDINNFGIQEIDHWIPDRIKLSFPEVEKNFVIESLILGIQNSLNKYQAENIVFKKYQKVRYNQIATTIQKRINSLKMG